MLQYFLQHLQVALLVVVTFYRAMAWDGVLAFIGNGWKCLLPHNLKERLFKLFKKTTFPKKMNFNTTLWFDIF
jgi:hypothetical protein